MYQYLLFIHLLLFVFWLGGDLGVFVLGQQSRRKHVYSNEQRQALLKVLIMVDMGPRTCIALMVPISLTLAHVGSWWIMPWWLLAAGWIVGAVLLTASWTTFLNHGKPIEKTAKAIDFWLQILMALFYGGVAVLSLINKDPIAQSWLAGKTLLYSLIFVCAILIDFSYRPMAGALQKLQDAPSPETEKAVLAIQNQTRRWVMGIYVLLFLIGFFGSVKPSFFG